MSAAQRAERIFAVLTSLATIVVLHGFLGMWAGIGVCGGGGGEPSSSAVCGDTFGTIWWVLFLNTLVATLAGGVAWIAKRTPSVFAGGVCGSLALAAIVAMALAAA